MRVAARLGAQMGDEVIGDALPLHVEVDRRLIEERESGAVGRLFTALEQRGVEGVPEPAGGDIVDPRVTHNRRRADGVEDALHRRPVALPDWTALPRDRRVRCAGEVEEVGAFGVVEAERPSERLEHAVGHAGDVPALQAPVVVDADLGRRRDLLAAQTRKPPGAVGRQPRRLRRDPRAARSQELRDVVREAH